jgi:hypothetical protein
MVNGGKPRFSAVAAAGRDVYLMKRCPNMGTDMRASASIPAISWPTLLASLLGGAIVAVSLGLWAYFGTAVFFEMVRNGFAACF